MTYEIYTDGACSGNPGKGGYAFVIYCWGKEKIRIYGHKENTTNNCMELTAIVKALKHAQSSYFATPGTNNYTVYSDSAYCVNSINQGWVKFWKANNWLTKSGTKVKNQELWEELLKLTSNRRFNIKFVKVKGHSGNEKNELVDYLAKKGVLLEGKKDLSKSAEGVR
jgi:ribonuclease HI